MKAAVITKDFQLQVWDLPEPSVGEYDVLCKIEYGTTLLWNGSAFNEGRSSQANSISNDFRA